MEVVLHESTIASPTVRQEKSSYEEVKGANHSNKEKSEWNFDDPLLSETKVQSTIDIQFENVTFTADEGRLFGKKTRKMILQKVNGRFPAGKLIAIMGPSGAGKSTLLDVLSGYRIHNINGTVYMNEKEREIETFRKLSCYITQDDRLQPLLTVMESMLIAADLKLATNIRREKKIDIIEKILVTLGLNESKETKVSRLSGGQKKRMSIALELISNPLVMFLDEPTTGLDSSSCKTCIELLKELAGQGRTIICTIHQPSATLFQLFDIVYVLSAGRCLYQGNTENLVPFLEAVGSPCPQYHNPADYVIELASEESGKDVIDKMVQTSNNGRSLAFFKDAGMLSNSIPLNGEKDENYSKSGLLATSQYNQLKVLLRRGYIKSKRDPALTYLRIGVNAMVGLMLGTVYWKAGTDGSKVIDNYNLLFSLLMHHMMSTMMLTILTFPTEMSILIKEHFNRWYSLKMYYVSVTLVDIPLSIFCTFIFTIILYPMTAQPMELNRFMMFYTTSALVVFVAQSFGLMIGAYFNVVNGTFLGPTLSVPMMMFAGFGVRLCDLPTYLYWGSYISYLRFGLEGLVGAVYGLDRGTLECPEDKYCHYKYPKKLLNEIGIPADQFGNDVVVLLLFVFVLKVAAFVLLKCKLRAVR